MLQAVERVLARQQTSSRLRLESARRLLWRLLCPINAMRYFRPCLMRNGDNFLRNIPRCISVSQAHSLVETEHAVASGGPVFAGTRPPPARDRWIACHRAFGP